MTVAARVQAQAKINLDLVVHPPDETGFHPLETWFHRLDLADDVQIQLGGARRSLEVRGPRVPEDGLGPSEENLAFRAAELYLAHNGRGLPSGFAIGLTKNIPVAGGLGGGSADAGAVLRALNALAPRGMHPDELVALAASLGSDVPFLASECVNALGWGRGELFAEPKVRYAAADVLLLVPTFGVATKEAYGWLDADRASGLLPRRGLRAAPEAGWSNFADSINDFEPVVERRHVVLRNFRERLVAAGATVARLSGSGSTVFGIFEHGAPNPASLGLDATVLATRTSARVVQVEVLQ